MRSAYEAFVRKPQEERLPSILRRRYDIIGVGLTEVVWEVVDCICLPQDGDQQRGVMTALMILPFPLMAGNF